MNRSRWLAVIVVALVLSAGLTFLIFRIVKKRLQPPEETTKIVVAAEKMERGSPITEENVKLADWPTSSPVEASFQSLDEVMGRGVQATIYPGDPITDLKLVPREGGTGLTSLIPDRMRAQAVKVDSVIGVAGFVQPGDHVDVVLTGTPPKGGQGMVARIAVENIEVLSVGQQIEQDAAGKPVNVPVVTLSVTPEQAQEIALAGIDKIQLILRNRFDKEEIDPVATEREELYEPEKESKPKAPSVKRSVQPAPAPPKIASTPPKPKPEVVPFEMEIYKGTNKEIRNFNEKTE